MPSCANVLGFDTSSQWLDIDRSGLLEVDEFLPLFVKYATGATCHARGHHVAHTQAHTRTNTPIPRAGKELRHLNIKEREEWATDLAHGEDCISRKRLDSYLQEEAARYALQSGVR